MSAPEDPLKQWYLPAEPVDAGELTFNGIGGFFDQVSVLSAKLPFVPQLGQCYLLEFRFQSSVPDMPPPQHVQFVGDLKNLSHIAVIIDDLVNQLEDGAS